jgi:hypothetical protein
MSSVTTPPDAPTRRPTRLASAWATARLLYGTDPRAFVVSSIASLAEPIFYPAFLLLLQRLLTEIAGEGGAVHVTTTVELIGAAMLAILLDHLAPGGVGGDQQAHHGQAALGPLHAL